MSTLSENNKVMFGLGHEQRSEPLLKKDFPFLEDSHAFHTQMRRGPSVSLSLSLAKHSIHSHSHALTLIPFQQIN
jgi:hypothetical protein